MKKDNVIYKCIEDILIVALLILIAVILYFYVNEKNENKKLSAEMLKDKTEKNVSAYNAMKDMSEELINHMEERSALTGIDAAINAMKASDYPMREELVNMLSHIREIEEIGLNHPETVNAAYFHDIYRTLQRLSDALNVYRYSAYNMTYSQLNKCYEEMAGQVNEYMNEINDIYDAAIRKLEMMDYKE